jgi:hypothetical protein
MPANKAHTETSTGTWPEGMAGTGLPLAIGTAALRVWSDLGTEAVRFVRGRLQEDIKTQQALLDCTNLEELRTIQARHFVTAQVQYAAETRKMLELLGKATTAGLKIPARRYDDVPL